MKRTHWIGLLVAVGACGGARGSALPPTTVLTPPEMNAHQASYSPDGSRVAYFAASARGEDLVVARADLSAPHVLASGVIPILASWSPDERYIAYESAGPNGLHTTIVAVDSVGAPPMTITNAPGFQLAYQWDASSRKVAYASTVPGGSFVSRVFSLASRTSEPMLQGVSRGIGAWSRDGARIVYTAPSPGDSGGPRSTLWLTDSTGRRGRQLTNEGHESLPSIRSGNPWSPDGKSILYISNRTGKDDIWVWSVFGDSARQLTHDVLDDNSPVWSPDGQWVAFISQRTRQPDLWIIPAKGGTARRVTDTPEAESEPAWVPGTDKLTYTIHRESSGLWVYDLGDSTARRLTADSVDLLGTPWDWDLSPDGHQVAFAEQQGGMSRLAVMPAAGGTVTVLAQTGNVGAQPEWSPDGSRILFLSDRSGHTNVWMVDAAGGTPRQLTDWPADDGNAAWSHDGSTVYVSSQYQGKFFGNSLWRVPVDGGRPHPLTPESSVFRVVRNPRSDEVFVVGLGKRQGKFGLYVLLPNGALRLLWNRTAVLQFNRYGADRSGDSVMINTLRPDGDPQTMLVSTKTGEGHPMPDVAERATEGLDWAPDGNRLLFAFGQPNADLGIYDRSTGHVTVLTHTPHADEGPARWLPDGRHVIFQRSVSRSEIVTADLTKLMAGGK